jgi:NAD(P)-dependent dehydrogenase (short-subunit alcohol dehydrogenase family)
MATDYRELFNLEGRVAVVTGASGGIGKAIALALAAHGADVLVAGRNPDKTRQAAAELAASGRRAVPCSLEITSRASTEAMAAAALKEFGRIDILVNSAGMNIRKEILAISEEDWDQVLTTNIKGVLYCCQAVGRHLVGQEYGKVVNISSISSFLGHPARGAYAASKGGLIQLTRVMATEWAPHKVNVNAISPAAVDTPFIDGRRRTGSAWTGSWSASPWPASAPPRTWLEPRCSWPPAPRTSSPARTCSSTAAGRWIDGRLRRHTA